MHSLVETGVGTVRGRIDADGVHAFQGIPYGQPPTGAPWSARARPPKTNVKAATSVRTSRILRIGSSFV